MKQIFIIPLKSTNTYAKYKLYPVKFFDHAGEDVPILFQKSGISVRKIDLLFFFRRCAIEKSTP